MDGSSRYEDSSRLTMSATIFPSARPVTFGLTAFMTLPMSPGPENPPSAIVVRTSSVICSTPICSGR